MYNIKLANYVPEPKPATTDCVVAAHYYAAWKKGAAEIHNGFDDLARVYPDRTPLMGYYDEENPEVCDWEIKWAVEHGINCFIHCWYRRSNAAGRKLEGPQDLRAGHGLHEALFNARYQKYMKFAIMFEASPRWGGTDPQDMIDNLLPFWMENYLKRENYLKIDNKPVIFIYNQARLSEDGFPDAAVQKETFDKCREIAKQEGFDGLIFGCCDTEVDEAHHKDIMSRGYDFCFGYVCGFWPSVTPTEKEVMDTQCSMLQERFAADPTGHLATASCFWSPEPRTTQAWIDLGFHYNTTTCSWHLTPENYRSLIHRMKAMTDALPEGAWGKKIFMIDNWNEWDEGHFVAPSHAYGFGYLQAIREELTACDNLPDYRMPQDQGFTGYNTSWVTPDFKEFCEEQLKEKE